MDISGGGSGFRVCLLLLPKRASEKERKNDEGKEEISKAKLTDGDEGRMGDGCKTDAVGHVNQPTQANEQMNQNACVSSGGRVVKEAAKSLREQLTC